MLPDRISATMARPSHTGAGSSVVSTTTSTTQIGMMTARWRSTVRVRQPASVSSCLTQSRFSGGSRKPTANQSQRNTPGSPRKRPTVSALQLADDLARRDGLADLYRQPAHRAVLVRRQRLLHLHRLEHHDRVAGRYPLALLGDDLHDRALHRADQGVAVRRGPAARRPRAAAARALRRAPRRGGRAGAEPGRYHDLQPLAA